MGNRIGLRVVTGALLMLLALPGMWAAASAPALTPTQKAAFDRTAASAGGALAAKLTQQLKEYESWTAQSREWERKKAELHYRSEEKTVLLRQRIKMIDAEKLAALKQEAEQVKERHQKLFDAYRTVNRQLEAAKLAKNKTLTALFQSQADALRLPVQLARQEIRNKEEACQSARREAQAKMKKVRGTLDGIVPLQVRVRAAKDALAAPEDSRRSVWRSFTAALSKKDAKAAADQLASVNSLTRQIVERLQGIHELEQRIADIVRSAETQLG